MKAVWTKGLKTGEKSKREEQFKQAREILDTLIEVLEDKERKARKAVRPDYISGGWPYQAADNNGYIRAVQEIKTILEE